VAAQAAEGRLRLTTRSIVVAVAIVLLGMASLRVLARSERVVMWVLVAGTAAGVVHPLVVLLQRRMPRGLAIVVVGVVSLAGIGLLSYSLISGVLREAHALEEAAPRVAAEVQRSGRYSDLARQIDLAEKTKQWVSDIPGKLTGGTAGAVRSAADYAVTVTVVGILAVFFLLQGAGLVRGAARQWPDPERAAALEKIVLVGLRRSFAYLRRVLATAAAVGAVSYGLARWAGLPAPIPLALWVALWSVLPIAGTLVGAIPLVVLALFDSTTVGVLLALAFIAVHTGEVVVHHYWVNRGTVHVGPFLALLALFAGFEWRSVAGAVLVLLLMAFAMAASEEASAGEVSAGEAAVS